MAAVSDKELDHTIQPYAVLIRAQPVNVMAVAVHDARLTVPRFALSVD